MQEINENIHVLKLPRCADQLFGYQIDRGFRWIVLYFDPITYEVSPSITSGFNLLESLQASIDDATDDLKKHKLTKIMDELKSARRRHIEALESYGEDVRFIDDENPWRVVDHELDAGASRDGLDMLINHPRINKSLDRYFELQPGGFKSMFMEGKAMFMFDREKLELHAGGEMLLEAVEDVHWKMEEDDLEDIISDSKARRVVESALNDNPILIDMIRKPESIKKKGGKVISFSKFIDK